MANTTKKRRRIEQDLYSHFNHPSLSLKKKWGKRRAEQGSGQDVLDQEFREWLNEGQELKELKVNYKKRLANKLWNQEDFQQDVNRARQIYLKNIKLPPEQQEESCMGRLTQELSNKYHLNRGWLLWTAHCIREEKNTPDKLLLYVFRKKGENAKYISLDVYFPLPESVYAEATIYLRMNESEVFGDYYSQQEHGGRKVDQELYMLFEQWKAVEFDPKKKKVFCKQYVDAHLNNPFAKNDFDQAMKRYKRKYRGAKSVASD